MVVVSGCLNFTLNKMIKILIPLVLILAFFGCRNYDNQRYIDRENLAIESIIHQMIDFYSIVESNNLDTKNLKLYLISTLDTNIFESYPGLFLDSEEYKADLEKSSQEKKLFVTFRKGAIKSRELNHQFDYTNLEVVLLSESPENLSVSSNELGYLYVSRIVFNRSFSKGYLSFRFFCGEACAFGYNIEIVLIDNTWEISRYFSGFMA